MVKDLVSAGAAGRQPQNLSRDISRMFAKESCMPSLYWASGPMQAEGELARTQSDLPFLLLHEVIGNIVSRGHSLHEIPANMPQLKQNRDKTARALGLPPDLTIPIGVHGDGVPHQKKGTVEVISWNQCAGFHERTLFCVLDKAFLCDCGCKGRCTIDAALSIFVWSMNCLTRG